MIYTTGMEARELEDGPRLKAGTYIISTTSIIRLHIIIDRYYSKECSFLQ